MNGERQTTIGSVETQFLDLTAEAAFRLRRGGVLPQARIAYETYGTLNSAKDNAVLVFHALSGSQHAAGINNVIPGVGSLWTEECRIGWWDDFIGPGKAINTDHFFVVCANYLGGCYGSTGPSSINPDTERPWGGSFPWITVSDIVDTQMLLLKHLGINRLHAAIGGSLGGLMCLDLAVRYPEQVKIVIPVASGLTVTVLQRIHNFEQIYAIEHDPNFRSGDYYKGPAPVHGLALARMIGHKTFVSLKVLEERARAEVVTKNGDFGQYQITHAVESYMLHQGRKFVQRFDANTYLCISGVWQSFDLLKETGCSSFEEAFSRCRAQRYMVFSIDSDVCYYPQEQVSMTRELKRAKVPVRHITVHSDKGHDSFLLEPELFAPHLSYSLENGW